MNNSYHPRINRGWANYIARCAWPMAVLVGLVWPTALQGQFTYTVNNGAVTITGYNGPGGAVIIPSTINGLLVTTIGDSAFFNRPQITSVTIPSSVTHIAGGAFYACTHLNAIVIPSSVNIVEPRAFADTPSLTQITVDPLNPAFTNLDGVLFDKQLTRLVACPGGKAGSYLVPGTVSRIGDFAFERCDLLTSVVIPDSVSNLGYAPFYFCGGLASVSLPNSITSISEETFDGCTNLASVNIPRSVTWIGDWAFDQCTSLEAIAVDPLNPTFTSVDGVLFNKDLSTLVACPGAKAGDYVIPSSVTTITRCAFGYCTRLTSVVIPNSVVIIPEEAFWQCSGLVQVTVPAGVTKIGRLAFSFCSQLANITIPDGVTSIGEWAFIDCGRLVSITIPAGVTSLADCTFRQCYLLRAIYFKGNAPTLGLYVFDSVGATAYYLLGTSGWGPTFGGLRTEPWGPPPSILRPPQTQTAESGSAIRFSVAADGLPPLSYSWYFNGTNLLPVGTNRNLLLTAVAPAQAGAYTVLITNIAGAVTSAPALLQVIPPVERRLVPTLNILNQSGVVVNVSCADTLEPGGNWVPLGTVSLAKMSELYLDTSAPLPPVRFYRVWQTNPPATLASVKLAAMVPAITLTGEIGTSVRLDYLNAIGPTDAWVTLDTVLLTNTSQLYFDTASIGQPRRLYRVVQSP